MKRKIEVTTLPFYKINPCDPEVFSGMLRVGKDSDGYEYYTNFNGKRTLSSEDSKLGINRIKKFSKSMITAQGVDAGILSKFLEEMSSLCKNGDIVGLSIFKHEVNSSSVFNAEIYNDYTVEDSTPPKELEGFNTIEASL